jgi:hypothetical protein
MVKLLAGAAGTLSLLVIDAPSADMVAGVFRCSSTESQLIWEAASPDSLLMRGSQCGFNGNQVACPTTTSDLLDLVEKKSCKGARAGSTVEFVCARNNENDIEKIIGDFCEAVIP